MVDLWCPHDVAVDRLIARGTRDLQARLDAWASTARLARADVVIDTSEVDPNEAARAIDRHVNQPPEGQTGTH